MSLQRSLLRFVPLRQLLSLLLVLLLHLLRSGLACIVASQLLVLRVLLLLQILPVLGLPGD